MQCTHVELHRRLTLVGVMLLVVTFVLNSNHSEGFNYAYIPGVAMLVAFGISFVIFTKGQLRES
ncbi:MAG: hypothetical protein D9C04_04585 [Nitrosopumilus sp. B06]|nr:MAG: hypothetical protein EB828_06835 [Nitrosopumilus sp. D6]RNJ79525.1 MAG: hypothetical protein D9C04_04585 [Nitrosopumilus sp. B06]